jgi:TonB family protein
LERYATSDEIRESYLVLVKVWHPDRFQEDESLKRQAGDKLAAINSAYQYLLKNQASRPKGTSATASGYGTPPAGTGSANTSYQRSPTPPQRTNARTATDIVTVAGGVLVLLLVAGAYVAKRPNKSVPAEIVDGPTYLSPENRPTTAPSDKPSTHKEDTADDRELHLVANLFGGGATSDGRTYSVALIAAYQGKIPPRTALFVQGVIVGKVGPRFISIRDEQDPQKTLLCGMTAEEFDDSSFLFQAGDRVQAYGIYALTASGIPALQDCRLASPTDHVVRPEGDHTTQAPLQAAATDAPPAPREPETDTTNDSATDTAVRRIGGNVSPPLVLFAPEPEFSEQARQQKVAGNVLVYLQVGPDGLPTHVRVLRGIGMGLDEKAVEAVRQYKFRPAMENGRPVTVEMNVEVNFQIF